MVTPKAPFVQKRRRYADARAPRLATVTRLPARPITPPLPVTIDPEPERRLVTRDPRTNEVIE